MSWKLICQIYTELDRPVYLGDPEYETHVCNALFETCCKIGCCPNNIPWYIWLIIAISGIILFVALGVIYFYLRLYHLRQRRERRMRINQLRTRVTHLRTNINQLRTTHNNCQTQTLVKSEAPPPPEYSVAVHLPLRRNDVDKVPTYEEATAQN